MTGFILFQNAVLRVIRHLDEALAVSGLIWIGILIVQILTFNAVDMEALASGNPEAVAGSGIWLILLSNVVMAVGSCWIAVEWHRYALEGKRPTSAFPSWSGSRIWGYLILSIFIGLLIGLSVGLLGGLLLGLFGNVLAQALGGLFVVVLIIACRVRVFPALSDPARSCAGAENLIRSSLAGHEAAFRRDLSGRDPVYRFVHRDSAHRSGVRKRFAGLAL